MSDSRTIATVKEIKPGSMKRFDVDDHEIVVANAGGKLLAFDNVCTCVAHFAAHKNEQTGDPHTHGGHLARLSEGVLTGETVTCPMHRTVYNIRTGRALSGPGEIPVSTYEVRIDGDELRVALMPDSLRHFWNDPGHEKRP